MKKRFLRAVALVLAACVVLVSARFSAQAHVPATVDQLNTYQNTGNQRRDIVGVALTQMGYMEGERNDTKYGDWYGLVHSEWCAMFVSWCARQAEVSTDILYKTSWAHPSSFRVVEYSGKDYTPQPGDLFFTEKHQHVGIVWYVEGDFFYSLEGNAKPHDYTVPNDPSVESYHVMTNMRLISDHTFGVPEYEGTNPSCSYVRGVESAHPHKVYYKCSDCGDMYYTGYTEPVTTCKSCFTCGCDTGRAGYYRIVPDADYLRLRTDHDWGSSTVCYVTMGSVVYVYGISSDGWAYINFDGQRGHIPSYYLEAYPDAPAAPVVTTDQQEYETEDTVTIRWDLPENTEQLRVDIWRDGTLYRQERLEAPQSYQLKDLPTGTYTVEIAACNRAGISQPDAVEFIVKDTYTVTYDPGLGSDAPESQLYLAGETATVSAQVPVWEGYRFLGWTQSADSRVAELHGGDTLQTAQDVTLHAVWTAQDALPQSLQIRQGLIKTIYLPGESLDTRGLVLEMMYSDGAGYTVTDGFEISGFDTEILGTQTVTITWENLSATCQVQVVEYIPGDINGDLSVNRDDVIALLLHITMPDAFAVTVPADFTGDGQVTRDDVIALLLHVTMPDMFPLTPAGL